MILNYMNNLLQGVRNEKGQGMVEYALIMVFIALAIIVSLTGLGTALSEKFVGFMNAF